MLLITVEVQLSPLRLNCKVMVKEEENTEDLYGTSNIKWKELKLHQVYCLF